ncbi:octopamine receptor 1-like [Stylophora pistillata]|uniref:octopamine receptor 1-like n=1 Tax=Stylophora pistillata TaxID=50429 RepID=UPI000C050A1D|nr:octopamine receptor 1-like [Stylophora pistillata]
MDSPSPQGNNVSSTITSPPVDPQEFNFTAAMMCVVIFLALFGNGLVIAAFHRFHQLRTVTNYFVVSLAVADILVASLSMPCWMYIQLSRLSQIPHQIRLEKVLYYSWQYVDILCSTASIVNLCVISVDRHLAINSPLTYHSRMTPKRAQTAIALAWLFAFVCASLSMVTVEQNFKPIAGQVYASFISIAALFIPFFILIVMYSKIGCVAVRQVRQICAANSEIQHGIQREHNMTFRHELRITKMLGIVIGAFVLCWGPFFSIVLLYAVCHQNCPNDHGWVAISKWLHYANSTFNPLIYMLFTTTFRNAFRRLLVRGLCCMKLSHGGTGLNLNIWKAETVEPSDYVSGKTFLETTKVQPRKMEERFSEQTTNRELKKTRQVTDCTNTLQCLS